MIRDAAMLFLLLGFAVLMFISQLAFGRWLDAYRVVRRRVLCPAREREAVVDFLVDAHGPEVYRDVVDCSLLAHGGAIDCGKECRSTSIAPFGAPD